LLTETPQARLCFVGDGEDGVNLRREINVRGLCSSVLVSGFVAPAEVATWLNAADVVVSGSLVEGWSLAMLEALACGKPLVTTLVSGVTDMVWHGRNGFIVQDRDPRQFATSMSSALNLPGAKALSIEVADKYSAKRLGCDLLTAWPALRQAVDQNDA
jgi:colanic acid/amylovoran biosynthesis glycosyltransferase